MHFLNASSEEEFEMLKDTKVPIMERAVNVIYDLGEDTRVRELARMREKALHDETSALANAENRGRVEGRAEGRTEERNFLISKWKAQGMTDEQINALLN